MNMTLKAMKLIVKFHVYNVQILMINLKTYFIQ